MKKIIVAIGLSLVSFGSLFSQTKIYNLPLNIGTTWDWLPTTQGLNTVKISPSSLWLGIPFAIKDEGINVVGSGATSINFTGAGVTTTQIGNAVTVNIPSSGGGGGGTWGSITGTLSTQTDLNNALLTKQGNINLTTTGTSGAATLVGVTLNIPNYAGGGGGGTLLTNWVTSTVYTVGSFVTTNQTLYENLIAHTSGTFATDLGASRWVARLTGSLNAIAITSPATTGTINLTFDQNKDYAIFTQTGNITLTVAASPKVASTITMRIVGAPAFTLTMPAGSNNLNAGVFSTTQTNLVTLYMDANSNLDYTISNY